MSPSSSSHRPRTDELQATYLASIAEQVEQLVASWDEMQPDTRAALLAERDHLVEHADTIARSHVRSGNPGLADAQARWQAVREAFLSL